jgi:S-adenosylmethionine decarboxylase
LDYRVRGFTRDIEGKKYYIDHDINSIQDFLPDSTKNLYEMIDVNVYQENIFHTKMLLKHFDLNNYLFGLGVEALNRSERMSVEQKIRREMLEIFYSKNFSD